MIKTYNIQNITYLLTGILSFLYILIRAFEVGVTYDEVWTIITFVPLPFINIVNYTPCDANNHMLNTLIIKLLFLCKDTLFVARLPNVLAFIPYLYFSYKLTYKYLSPFIGVCCFLLLIFNPFVLDFFSLARGYGLALGFQLISLYFFILLVEKKKAINALLALSFGALSVLSNFAFLNYWIAILCIILLIAFFCKKMYAYKQISVYAFLVSLTLLLIMYEPIRKLKVNDNLYYGGTENFYADTLFSLTKYSFYSPVINTTMIFALNIFIAILLISVFISFFFNRSLFSSKFALILVTILCVLSINTQHFLFGTLYPIDRTALFFYPLFIIVLCFSLNNFSRKWYAKTIGLTCVLAFSINMLYHINFYKTAIWYFDAHSDSILEFFNKKGEEERRVIKIDFSWPFENSFAYYSKHYPYVKIVQQKKRYTYNKEADYYVFLNQTLEKVGYNPIEDKIVGFKKEKLKQYENEHIIIYKTQTVAGK